MKHRPTKSKRFCRISFIRISFIRN